MVNLVLDVKSS